MPITPFSSERAAIDYGISLNALSRPIAVRTPQFVFLSGSPTLIHYPTELLSPNSNYHNRIARMGPKLLVDIRQLDPQDEQARLIAFALAGTDPGGERTEPRLYITPVRGRGGSSNKISLLVDTPQRRDENFCSELLLHLPTTGWPIEALAGEVMGAVWRNSMEASRRGFQLSAGYNPREDWLKLLQKPYFPQEVRVALAPDIDPFRWIEPSLETSAKALSH